MTNTQIPYVQPNDNLGAQNLIVKDALVGDGVGCMFTRGNPNGALVGTMGQLAIDRVSLVVYQNTDNGTTWSVFGGGGPGATDLAFTHTCLAADGDSFEVLLPTPRSSTSYLVVGLMGINTANVSLLSVDTEALDRFTANLSATPNDGDTVSFIVKDITP